jgi:SAM-dependent methyltransferase
MENNLTDISYWEGLQGPPSIELDHKNIIRRWIDEKFVIFKIDSEVRSCIEIGCYPGRYLGMMSQRGLWSVESLYLCKEIPALIEAAGGRVGEFFCGDFREFTPKQKFDLIFSLGFIEHFNDWEELLRKHIEMVSPGGYLLIEVPNYRGVFQRIPRFVFDHEDYRRHNIEAMSLAAWSRICEDAGLEVLRGDAIRLWALVIKRVIQRKLRSLLVRVLDAIRRNPIRRCRTIPLFQAHSFFWPGSR